MPCGAFLQTPADINYTNPSGDGKEETCVWIVIPSKGGPMALNMISTNATSPSSLSIQKEFGNQLDSISRPLYVKCKLYISR